MVEIKAFKGLRFNIEKTGEFSSVIAPPYDIISQSQKESLKKANPYNIVNLTLPDETLQEPDKYARAKKILDKWIEEGILFFDGGECLYLFEETFNEKGGLKSFTGFIGLLKVEEYGRGKVLRHEKTLSKPKEDRLKLLTACRTNFEFIYTLFNDQDNSISLILDSLKTDAALISTGAGYDSTLKFRLWKISDKKALDNITGIMKTKTLLIADGHHRYETSRLYREQSLKTQGKDLKNTQTGSAKENSFVPEDYVLSLFVSSAQKDIIIHPTHRLIKFSKDLKPEVFKEKIQKYFKIHIIEPDETAIDRNMSAAMDEKKKCICICFKNGPCFFAVLNVDLVQAYEESGYKIDDFNTDFEYLDVNILHKFLLSALLKDYEIQDIKFVHTINEVLENTGKHAIAEDDYDAGFILNAPDIKTVEDLSVSEMIMPQKSTYFYPKPCSGLVLYKF